MWRDIYQKIELSRQKLEQLLSNSNFFIKRLCIFFLLTIVYILLSFVYAVHTLFFPSSQSFTQLYAPNPEKGYVASFSQHQRWVGRVKISTASSLLAVVFLSAVSGWVVTNLNVFASPPNTTAISNITITEDATNTAVIDLDNYFTPDSGESCTYSAPDGLSLGTMSIQGDGTVDITSTATTGGSVTPTSSAAQTVLLLHGDGANASTVISDSGANAKTVSVNGNAQISTTQSKFGGSSMYFDGDGDYLQIPTSSDFDLDTDWTIELWAYPTNTNGTKIISTRGSSGNGWEVIWSGGRFGFEGYGSNNTSGQQNSASTFTTNQWYHVAVVTTEGATKLYVNGTLEKTHNNNFTWSSGSHALRIGLPESYNEPYAGYVDDVRITKGSALYTSNFTAPDSTFSDVAFVSKIIDAGSATSWETLSWIPQEPYGKDLPNNGAVETAYSSGNMDMSSNTLLLHFNETGSPTTFADSSGGGHNATCTNTPDPSSCPTPSTTGKLNGAMSFDGSNDFITFADPFSFHTSGAATVSMWVKIPNSSGNKQLIWSRANSSDLNRYNMYIYNGAFAMDYREPGATLHNLIPYDDGTITVSPNMWHHITVTRSSNNLTYKVYLDGALAKTVTDSGVNLPTSTTWFMGGFSPNMFDGSMDEVATWTREFTSDQVLQVYKRGAEQLQYQVRSCDDAACSGETFVGPGESSATTDTSTDFDAADETNYTQEDATNGTDFSSGVATLHSTGNSATKFLMHADGANDSTTFTDESATAATMTTSGASGSDVTAVSTAEKYFGTGSAYFSGDADKLVTSSSNAYNFTGTYTQELWLKTPSSLTGNRRITMASNQHLQFLLVGSALHYAPQSGSLGVSTTLSPSTWYHIAVSRDANNILRWFINGNQVYSVSLPGTVGGTSLSYGFGKVDAGLEGCTGCYIDEVRLTDSAIYTGTSFTPSVAAFSSDNNTQLLLHGDGSNGATTFTDSSSSPYTVTANGGAQISTAQSTFGGAAAVFDGSGDYLSIPDSEDWNFSNGNWTVEMWLRPGSANSRQHIFGQHNWGETASLVMEYNPTKITTYLHNQSISATQFDCNYGGSFTLNQWYHIAVVRNNNKVSCFIDGQFVHEIDYADTLSNVNKPLTIGADDGGDSAAYTGYIDELRVSKGVVRYPNNVVLPTQTFTSDANTHLLLNGEGTDGATTFTDSSSSAHTVNNPNGGSGAHIETDKSRFGSSSILFDGANDYLEIPSHANFAFGDDDFTTEFWAYGLANSTDRDILFRLGIDSDAELELTMGSATATDWSSGGNKIGVHINYTTGSGVWGKQFAGTKSIVGGGWHHIALVRQGTSLKLYVDGVLDASDTYAFTYQQEKINIGGQSHADTRGFSGYIDDVRVSKGIARYTGSNFAIPSSAFVAVSYPTSQPYYVTTTNATQFSLANAREINSIDITDTQPTNTTIRALVSFDGRSTWKYYSAGSWQTAAGGLGDLQTSGMTIGDLETAFTNWTPTSETTLDFAFDLASTSSTATPSIDGISINYDTVPTGKQNTFYSEVTNSTTSLPYVDLVATNNLADNRYFQYKAFFSTDNSTYVPGLRSVSATASNSSTYTHDENTSGELAGGTFTSTAWTKPNYDTVTFQCTDDTAESTTSNTVYVYYPQDFVSTQTGNWNVGTTWGGTCTSSCVEGIDYPVSGSDATITAGHTVTVPLSTTASFQTLTVHGTVLLTGNLNTATNMTIESDGTVVQNNTNEQTLTGALTVAGTLTHSAHSVSDTSAAYTVKFSADTITINPGGAVNVDGKGYLGGQTANQPGVGASTGKGAADGGGGGHGGVGGNSSSSAAGGAANDSETAPVDLGSGGGSSNDGNADGGAGGGAIQLTATTSMTINGGISANGSDGAVGGNYGGGGGAGGSVNLTAPIVSGSGNISANGGIGGNGSSVKGGGGAGGRMVFSGVIGAVQSTGEQTANGGSATSPATSGASGTVTMGTITPVVGLSTYQQQTTDSYVDIVYTLQDANNDTQQLNVYEYSLDNSSWNTMTTATDEDHSGLTGLSSSSAGEAHTFVWDACADVDGVDDSSVYVRLRSNDGVNNSSTTTSAAFAVDCAAPTGLSQLTFDETNEQSVTVTWTAATEAHFSHYEIHYGTNETNVNNGTASVWSDSDDAALGSLTTDTTTITGLTSETTYYFRIWAVDTFGNRYSPAVAISAQTSAITPTTPTIASPTDNQNDVIYNPSIEASAFVPSFGSVHALSDWQISDDNTFSNINCSDANIVWCAMNQSAADTITVDSESGSFQNALAGKTALQQNTTYYIRVRYKGNITNYSAWSDSIAFTTANSAPTFGADITVGAWNEDSSSVEAIDLDDQFTDEGDLCTYTVIDDPAPNIAVTINEDGTVDFVPASNFNGAETVAFRCTDSQDATVDSNSITLTVNGVNDAPSFTKGADQSVDQDSPGQTVTGWATGISQGDGDSGQELNFIVTNNNNSLFSVQPNVDETTGNLTYTPAPHINGAATVSVALVDNGGVANGGDDTSNVQTFTITIEPVDGSPIADAGEDQNPNEDVGSILLDGTGSNDSDGEITYQWTEVSDGTNSCVLSNATSVSPSVTIVDRESDYTCQYQLTVSDGVNQSSDSVTIAIDGVNDVPELDTITDKSVDIGSLLTFTVYGNDVDSAAVNFTVVESDFASLLTDNEDNTATFSWQPEAGQEGVYSITIVASDGIDSVEQQLTLTVNGSGSGSAPEFDVQNPLPNIAFIAGTTTNTLFDLDEYFTDPDNQTLSYSVGGNQKVDVTINEDGTVTMSAPEDFSGTEQLIFTAQDTDGYSAQSNQIIVDVSEESENIVPIDHVAGRTKGKGTVRVYAEDGSLIAEWDAYSKGGVIPKLVVTNESTSVVTVKKRRGSTIHIYTSEGQILKKHRLSPKLHYRNLAVGEIDGKGNTFEIVISTKRASTLYFKQFTFTPETRVLRRKRLVKYRPMYGNVYRLTIKKRQVQILNKRGRLVFIWNPGAAQK